MEKRNLDLGVPVSAAQWDMVSRTARELGREEGFDWKPEACNEVELYMRAAAAPPLWRDWIPGGDVYGGDAVRAATFVWNDGEPFARNELNVLPESPNVLPQDVERMQAAYEKWVHGEWQRLWHASGIPYVDAGNVEQV